MFTPASLVTRDTGLLELGAGAGVTRPVLLSSCWTSRDMLLLAHSSLENIHAGIILENTNQMFYDLSYNSMLV